MMVSDYNSSIDGGLVCTSPFVVEFFEILFFVFFPLQRSVHGIDHKQILNNKQSSLREIMELNLLINGQLFPYFI